MSIKIKYRVWDNENKSYDDPYSSAYYALTQDGGLDFYCHGDHMKEASPDMYFIEQYTGLRDKNGKEIFQGDIVKSIPDGNVYEIDWFDDKCGWFGFENTTGEDYIPLYRLNCVIIGNIHENPELKEEEE